MTPEQVVALRADRVFRNEIWLGSFGEVDSITETSVQEAQRKYEEQLIAEETARHQTELNEREKRHQIELNQLNKEMERASQKSHVG